jgi:trk system potassium uptake protein TrkH
LIRFASIGVVLGQFLLGLALALLVPLAWAWTTGSEGGPHFALSAGLTAAAGAALIALLPRSERELNQREALLLVVSTWLASVTFGAIPFALSPHFPSIVDSVFEAASGFTTTGATVLSQVEVLPEPLQLWRCFTHWIGGMGIVLLGIAILPLVGHGGKELYRAEFSGARSEKLKPRLTETALALWRIYAALTVAQFIALRFAGMTPLDALCHTFSTLGTGGFSTRTASVAAFQSPLIEGILILFMLLAGVSFVQHYRLWIERRPGRFFGDVEVRAYFLLVVVGTGVVGVFLVGSGYAGMEAFRVSVFQVISILTTTGFTTDNYEAWPPLPQVLLLAMMFVGGCTGSTAGGLKTARIVLLARVVDREFKRMVEPRGVFPVRLGGQVVSEPTVQSLLNLVYLAFVVNFVAVLTLAACGVDVLSAISAVAACMFNVGPALGSVGPAEHYGHLPALAKLALTACMIAGRLEFYTVLVVLTPPFWRR